MSGVLDPRSKLLLELPPQEHAVLKMHRRDFDVGIAHTFKIIVGGKAEHRYMQMRVGAVIAKINAKFAAMKPATTLRISPGIQRGTYRLEHRHTTLKRKKLARK